MIRVLVVEDEIPILRNLCNMIEKTSSAFKVEYRAQNGEDAYEIIKEHGEKIDLMFLDIHMPVLNGLELLNILKQEKIEIRTIILSGYQEFEYLRAGMRYGVLDYLLKPINKEALENVLREAESEIVSQAYQKQKQEEDMYKEYEVALISFWGNYLSKEKRGLGLILTEEQKHVMNKFKSYISKKLNEEDYWIIEDGYKPEWFVIFKKREGKIQRILYKFIEDLSDSKRGISILLDAEYQCRSTIYSKRLQMAEDIQCILEIDNNSFCHGDARKEHKENLEIIEQYRKEIQSARHVEEIGTVISKTLEKAGNKVEVLCELLKSALYFYSEKYPCNVSCEQGLEEVYQIIEESTTFEYLKNQIVKWSDSAFSYGGKREKKKNVAEEVKEYIEENYADNLTTQDIANQVGFVADYMRSLFGREYGMTPMEYMQSIRLEKSRSLLLNNPELSFKEIANIVGYQDASYFSRVFKKIEGVSPSQYRRLHMK
ncbi:MAG: AraC family transcriptional regulator [Eubacteriales bacterium]